MPLGNGAPSLESSVSQLLARPVPGAGKPRRQRITGRSRRVSPEGLLGPPAPLPSADPRPESAPPPRRHGPANQRARHPSPRQRAGQSAAGSPAWPRPLLASPAGRCRNCQSGGRGRRRASGQSRRGFCFGAQWGRGARAALSPREPSGAKPSCGRGLLLSAPPPPAGAELAAAASGSVPTSPLRDPARPRPLHAPPLLGHAHRAGPLPSRRAAASGAVSRPGSAVCSRRHRPPRPRSWRTSPALPLASHWLRPSRAAA